jgi:hypothetical protein
VEKEEEEDDGGGERNACLALRAIKEARFQVGGRGKRA